MLAMQVTKPDPKDPVGAVTVVDDAPEPPERDGWTTVTLRTAALNHHDVWALRGDVRPEWLPQILGSDGAGIDEDGNEVILHSLVADPDRGGGDETLDLQGAMLSVGLPGTFAERIAVPRRNLVPKPEGLSWEAAGSLGTAWLTAYRMLFTKARLSPGATVLVQGAGGGVATALIVLGRAAGLTVWVTSTDEAKRRRAVDDLGASAAFASGARLPDKVDAVMESVGEATWEHSLRSVRPGGIVVVCGATTGPNPPAQLLRVFLPQVSVVGSTMGTLEELRRLVRFCGQEGLGPVIDSTWPLRDARAAVERMVDGDAFGKIVLDCSAT
ncbi:MAG: zinc-binding dehydrogenase [Solirubrobacteraceae bacterium]|nr:zinc-binding dehydrogenase [Solirubrobacteraceae bacterium]